MESTSGTVMAVHNAGALLYCNPRKRLVTNYPIRLSEAKGAAVLDCCFCSGSRAYWERVTDRVTGVQVEPVMDNSEKLTICDSRGILYPQR